MTVVDLNAAKKWNKLPKSLKRILLDNIYCSSCGVTGVNDYSLYEDRFGVLIKGTCETCGGSVTRLVEVD